MRTMPFTRNAAVCLFAAGAAGFAAAAAVGPTSAVAGQGLAVTPTTETSSAWSPWQGRIAYSAPVPAWRNGLGNFESGGFAVKRERGVSSLNLLGDYFFAPSLAPSGGAGGLRATSGIIIGTRSQLSISQPSLPGGLFGTTSRVLGAPALPYNLDAGVEPATLPYVGVGYTGLAPGSGWSFSADLGLVGNGASNAASRLFGSGQRSLDESARDMRLIPLVQVGVQYSF